MRDLKGALDPEIISAKQFPKVFAWIDRFNAALAEAKKKAPKPASLKGDAAAKRVLEGKFADGEVGVSASDPLRLHKDQLVEVWPTDSGFRHRDRGRLIGLTEDEVVVVVDTGVRLHFPRTGFRVAAADDQAKL